MSEGLEALRRMYEHLDVELNEDDYAYKIADKDYDIIEKELKDYYEIKEIAKRYNWDDITSEIFNVETDKKYRDLFDSAIVNIQEDYRKARALEIIEENLKYGYVFIGYDKDNKPLFQFADTKLYGEMKRIKGTTTLDSALEETLIKACPSVAKKLKALEVIKALAIFIISQDIGGLYSLETIVDSVSLVKEEYDLLKEVGL